MTGWILMNITGFLGRFHPLLVHLPIGFLILAILVEWRGGREKYQSAIAYMWMATAITAFGAALCGWFLANQGSYGNWTLFFHRWLGIGIGVLALAGWYYRKDGEVSAGTSKLTNWLAIILLVVTGHLGGNLTHGPQYLLEYAPKPIKKILGAYIAPDNYTQYKIAEDVIAYKHLIHPILERKCMSCHNDKTQLGGLNLANREAISKGGISGTAVKPRDLTSELLNRVTISAADKKYMPTSGIPMTYDEVKILEWWIMQGASYDAKLTDLNVSASVESSLNKLFSLTQE